MMNTKGCGVRRGGKYSDGLVQQGVGALRGRGAQIDAAVEGAPPAAPVRVTAPQPPPQSKSYEQIDAEIAAARAKMNAPKKFLGLFKDGAVIPGHDTSGKDDVPVKVTRGEAILPVKTVDAMGGPMAVSDMIHATNGKPPAGVRRGGEYANGATGYEMPEFKMPDVFSPGTYGGMRPLTPRQSLTPEQALAVGQKRNAPAGPSLADQIPNDFSPATPQERAHADVMAGGQGNFKGGNIRPDLAGKVTPLGSIPSSDPRLAALGVTSDWKKLTEARDQPIQNAEIYATGRGSKGQPNSFAGYGTQTPEMEAADRARADAAHARTMGAYERESQARLGTRIAAARLRGEDAYADTLEREAARKEKAGLERAKVGAGSEGLGELRAAQTRQTELGTEQAISKQAMTDEYLKADTTPERRKVLAATLGIKPDSGWQISTTFGPVGPDGQPTKSTIAHRTTASGELETRDLSGGTQAAAPLAVGSKANQPDGSYVAHGKTVTIKNGTVTEIK